MTVGVSAGGFSVSPTSVDGLHESEETQTVDIEVTWVAPSTPGTGSTALTVTRGSDTNQCNITGTVVDTTDGTVVETHLLLEVPNYGDTTFQTTSSVSSPDDGTSLHSFLRLGKFDYDSEPPRAQKLLELIPQVTSATDPTDRVGGQTNILPAVTGFPSGTIFADDIRTRPDDTAFLTTNDDPDHKLTRGGRTAESARLYARGGWRDHSDGNRISTTYGDKVEVVRGNYKMIVLGRHDILSDDTMGEAAATVDGLGRRWRAHPGLCPRHDAGRVLLARVDR